MQARHEVVSSGHGGAPFFAPPSREVVASPKDGAAYFQSPMNGAFSCPPLILLVILPLPIITSNRFCLTLGDKCSILSLRENSFSQRRKDAKKTNA